MIYVLFLTADFELFVLHIFRRDAYKVFIVIRIAFLSSLPIL
jgi:hypothetical protein